MTVSQIHEVTLKQRLMATCAQQNVTSPCLICPGEDGVGLSGLPSFLTEHPLLPPGTSQQRPAMGTGALAAADLGPQRVASALLEEVAISPTTETPELTQDWGNRILEGTNKTFCAPGHRKKEQ